MALPFIDPKRIAGMIVSKRGRHEVPVKPTTTITVHHGDGGEVAGPEDAELVECGEKLLKGVDLRDPLMIGQAIYEAIQKYEAAPHEEGPHIGEGEY